MAFNIREKRFDEAALAGRVLLALIFIISGLSKISAWGHSLQYMESKGFFLTPIFLAISIAVELIAGLSILLGYKARWGAAILFLYLIPTTFIFHNFWSVAGMERQLQLTNFLKNLSIMGGLAYVVAFGPGLMSIDRKLEERRHRTTPDEARKKIRIAG